MILKVCGMREQANIRALYGVVPDLMGLIFYPGSKRYVGAVAETLQSMVPFDLPVVGVLVNPDARDLQALATDYGLSYFQFHGDESPERCAEGARYAKVIKAFRIGEAGFDFSRTAAYAPFCDYFLFDAAGKGYGGTGRKFDWAVLSKYTGSTPFLLSGGLGPEDVAVIRAFRHPAFAGIDVNSGFELEPGLKDIDQLIRFKAQFHANEN